MTVSKEGSLKPLRQLNPLNRLVQTQRVLVRHAGHEAGEQEDFLVGRNVGLMTFGAELIGQ